jgi:7,8-dihydro-6-hydroxymethylpterin-pyrophosphokinase
MDAYLSAAKNIKVRAPLKEVNKIGAIKYAAKNNAYNTPPWHHPSARPYLNYGIFLGSSISSCCLPNYL